MYLAFHHAGSAVVPLVSVRITEQGYVRQRERLTLTASLPPDCLPLPLLNRTDEHSTKKKTMGGHKDKEISHQIPAWPKLNQLPEN